MDTTIRALAPCQPCGCDEWVMCPQHETANDQIVASQDAYGRLMDDAGLSRLARHYRAYRTEAKASGTLGADLERYEIFVALQSERPITCPVDPMTRRWNRAQKTSRLAPSDSLLTVAPVSAPTDRSKINW